MSAPIRVLLVAPPFSGHLNPIVAIAEHLRTTGMHPHLVTGPARVPGLLERGFAVDPILADDPGALERIADTPVPVGNSPIRLGRQLRANLELLPRAMADLDAVVGRVRPDVVVADFTAPIAGLSAQRHGVPWITTMPTPFAVETRTGTPSYCGGWAPPRHRGEQVRDAAGRATTRAVKATFGVIFRRRLRELGTSIYRPDGTEAAYSPTTILGLGLAELEFPRDWPAAMRLIGPLTADSSHRTGATGRHGASNGPRVLVTLGTHLWWAKRRLVEQVVTLSQRLPEVHFVVNVGQPLADPDRPAVEAAPRVHVCDYLSYDRSLEQFDAVVHHGGAGISYAALRAGLPALVWPHDYDQFDFAARLTHAGVARRIRGLHSSDTTEALRVALDGLDRAAIQRLRTAILASDPLGASERAIRAVTDRG